jgi:hypothetical protein
MMKTCLSKIGLKGVKITKMKRTPDGRFYTLEGEDLKPIFKPLHRKQRYKHGRIPVSESEAKIIEYKPRKFRSIKGWDTETKNGNIYLISCSYKQRNREEKTASIFTIDPYTIFYFMLNYGNRALNVFFNLSGYDSSVLLKGLIKENGGKKKVKEILRQNKPLIAKDPTGKNKNIKVRWIPDKHIIVSGYLNGISREAVFFDVANFYVEKPRDLDSLHKKYCGTGKADFGLSNNECDVKKSTKELGYSILKHRCELDARFARDLMEILFCVASEKDNIPRYWDSPASLSQTALIKSVPERYLKPFKDCSLHRKALEYATRSYKGGLFCNYVKGRFDNQIQVDLVSAYPTEMKGLADLVNGEWREVDEVNDEATFGFYRVMRQFDGQFSPFHINHPHFKQIIYPESHGLVEDYITKIEYDYFTKLGYQIVVLDGVEFHHLSKPQYPFVDVVDSWFYEKKKADLEKNPALKMFAKLVLNSLYGKMAQSKHGLGILFNPIYASYITAGVRIRIARDICPFFKQISEIATDSVTGELKPNAVFTESKELGGLEVKFRNKTLVIMNTGFNAVEEIENGEKKLYLNRFRGFLVESKREIVFKNNQVVSKGKRVIKLKLALTSKKFTLDDIGKILDEQEKTFSLDDEKRLWLLPKGNRKITEQLIKTAKISSFPLDDDQLEVLVEITYPEILMPIFVSNLPSILSLFFIMLSTFPKALVNQNSSLTCEVKTKLQAPQAPFTGQVTTSGSTSGVTATSGLPQVVTSGVTATSGLPQVVTSGVTATSGLPQVVTSGVTATSGLPQVASASGLCKRTRTRTRTRTFERVRSECSHKWSQVASASERERERERERSNAFVRLGCSGMINK